MPPGVVAVASEQVRNTAFGVALQRALEQHTPPAERLVEDPLSVHMFVWRAPA